MPIVAYGYGLDQLIAAAGGDGLILALLADPDIVLEPDPVIEVEDTPVTVDVDPDITIEVE